MDKIRSLYLEFLRISAALYVFIYHVGSGELGKELYFSTKNFNENLGLSNLAAHYFVIVFFVLSGFLITMSVCRPKVTFQSFLVARLGRLYSVLLPALIFSYLVNFLLIHNNIPASLIGSNDHLVGRFILNIIFLTQTWTFCSTPPLNTPFWSVNYEFIYYLIIASVIIVKRPFLKILMLGIILILAWPKVLLLFPSWFAGSMLYFIKDKLTINKKISLFLFIVSFLIIVLIIRNPTIMPLSKGTGDNLFYGFTLLFSWNYQADFLFALLVALNVYFLFMVSSYIDKRIHGRIMDSTYNLIRKIGNCSYTLYLFHLPLLFLFATILPYDKTNALHQTGMIILTLISVFFIARYTEWKVEFWRSLMQGFYDRCVKIKNYLTIDYNKV